jgi:probable aminopeptidase NPEPL1
LVLSDAVAHATKHLDVDLVVDMATLTGAQSIATGKMHAGILANTRELEERAVKAGLASGDLCYPLLYAPELLKKVSTVLRYSSWEMVLTSMWNVIAHVMRCL